MIRKQSETKEPNLLQNHRGHLTTDHGSPPRLRWGRFGKPASGCECSNCDFPVRCLLGFFVLFPSGCILIILRIGRSASPLVFYLVSLRRQVSLTSGSCCVSSGRAIHRRAPFPANSAHRRRETTPGFPQRPGKPDQRHEWLLPARAHF